MKWLKILLSLLLLSTLLILCFNSVIFKEETHIIYNKDIDYKNEISLEDYGYMGYKIRGNISWSPDGKYLLFEATKYNIGGKNEYLTLLYNILEDNINVLSKEISLLGFDWSDDCKLLTYAITNEGLIMYNLNTKEKSVIDNGGAYPVISPDGKKIAYKAKGIQVMIALCSKSKLMDRGKVLLLY